MATTKSIDYEKELLLQVFEKIKREKGATSTNNAADILEDILLDKYNFKKSARTLFRNYNKHVLGKEESCGALTLELNNCLAKFLELEDYNEFVQSLKNDNLEIDSPEKRNIDTDKLIVNPRLVEDTTTRKETIKSKAPYFIIVLLILLGIANYFYTNTKVESHDSWMVWKTDHYEEYNNDLTTQGFDSLKLVLYNEMAIQNYRKIELQCEESIKKIWYYKVNKNKLELFNFPGLHPTNGKTLKAMTSDMKKKYVCN
ncbi:MAG: hypothetical protein HRT69_18160 [Flavobacteriaceae bacterium]|nr:hypothetical protein [Flavobacteriaceae bacterium]